MGRNSDNFSRVKLIQEEEQSCIAYFDTDPVDENIRMILKQEYFYNITEKRFGKGTIKMIREKKSLSNSINTPRK